RGLRVAARRGADRAAPRHRGLLRAAADGGANSQCALHGLSRSGPLACLENVGRVMRSAAGNGTSGLSRWRRKRALRRQLRLVEAATLAVVEHPEQKAEICRMLGIPPGEIERWLNVLLLESPEGGSEDPGLQLESIPAAAPTSEVG